MNDPQPQLIPVSERPFNAETPPQALREPLTPNPQFYVRNHFDVPSLDADSWSLQVNGAVNSPQTFTLEALQALPNRTKTILLECAGNGRTTLDPPIKGTTWDLGAVAQAQFTGIPLGEVLALAGPQPEAVEVRFTGADQGKVRTGETAAYARSLPLEMAYNPDVLLAWAMNGEPLPPDHGYPLRLVVPEWYGMASVKWLNEISLITTPFEGFFQRDDYVYVESQELPEGAPVQLMRVRSLILSHQDGMTLIPGAVEVSGIAWSGQGAIAEMAVSPDGGRNWIPAILTPPTGKYGWTSWRVNLEFKQPGEVTLMARAADTGGNHKHRCAHNPGLQGRTFDLDLSD